MQLSVSLGDHVMCLCFDRINHYKLFVITVHASLAQLCVWDPLDIEARKSSDSQAAPASLVMQKLLPDYKVEVVKPTSMCVLKASQVFATAQTYGYHCGPIAVRALVHLLFQTDFALGKHALHNHCVRTLCAQMDGSLHCRGQIVYVSKHCLIVLSVTYIIHYCRHGKLATSRQEC